MDSFVTYQNLLLLIDVIISLTALILTITKK